MKFITKEGLSQLDNYKYTSGGKTWLDLKMTYFWEWCVRQLPLWMAPNLITFIGWLFVIASYANMLRYDYTFTEDLPSSAFFFAAACIFIYSTLDAVDGKQARRTNSSSPLGQLFDHGCDSFSISFFMLAICQALRLEAFEVFLIFIACQTSFWVSNWSEYNTGILTTKVGQFGVTQGEYTCMLVHIFTGIYGQTMWRYKLLQVIPIPQSILQNNEYLQKFFNIQLGPMMSYFYSSLLLLISIIVAIRTILNSKTVQKSLFQYLSYFILVGMELVWCKMRLYHQYNGPILINFGLVASLLVCKMIICSVTKMKFQYFHLQIIPLMITTITIAILNHLGASIQIEALIFKICLGFNFIVIVVFVFTTVSQITEYLGIYCFSITKKRIAKRD